LLGCRKLIELAFHILGEFSLLLLLRVLAARLLLVELDLLVLQFNLRLQFSHFASLLAFVAFQLSLGLFHLLNLLLERSYPSLDDLSAFLSLSRKLVLDLHEFEFIPLPKGVLLTQEIARFVQHGAIVGRTHLRDEKGGLPN